MGGAQSVKRDQQVFHGLLIIATDGSLIFGYAISSLLV
jgi:hypothetical protein